MYARHGRERRGGSPLSEYHHDIGECAVQITVSASGKSRHETDNGLHGRIPVFPLSAPRILAELETLVAVFQPMDSDDRRKCMTRNKPPPYSRRGHSCPDRSGGVLIGDQPAPHCPVSHGRTGTSSDLLSSATWERTRDIIQLSYDGQSSMNFMKHMNFPGVAAMPSWTLRVADGGVNNNSRCTRELYLI